jgi:hypothetical protein
VGRNEAKREKHFLLPMQEMGVKTPREIIFNWQLTKKIIESS